jgi:hypothetical protein
MNKIAAMQDVLKIVVYSDTTRQPYIFNEITQKHNIDSTRNCMKCA